MAASIPSLENIQGLIVRPFTHPYSRHLLLRIDDAAAGRALLKALAPLVVGAGHWGDVKPSQVMNLSLTYNGLKAIKVNPTIVDGVNGWKNGFPVEFKGSGAANPDSTGQAGFTGSSDPAFWWPGSNPRFTSAEIHLILHLYALESGQLEDFTTRIRDLFSAQIKELLPMAGAKTIDAERFDDGKVHFGYRDGISQPDINWPGMNVEGSAAACDFRDFLLGYANSEHPSAPAGDFAADGSYLVFHLIYQDCAYFDKALKIGAAALEAKGIADVKDKEEWIAAKLLGRWRSGAPLSSSPLEDAPHKWEDNNFAYASDPHGHQCPFSAHVRVSNPRDQQVNAVALPAPRIIRRGAPYGPPLEGEVDDGVDRGLIGIFIGASISRQYLKIMKWIHRNDFSAVYQPGTSQDPIQGNREFPQASGSYRIPLPNDELVLGGLDSFVKTRGAAFCFMPSIATIQKLGAGEYAG